ncbi:hypothetical protein HIM_04344 [Hirsutella minnesotensis 3608]|uniref:Uncharacterized protein n=1 Tax=Hirsutella minnesotensis 3608 TaxID=1043627 RepID=A0A0F8A1J4_9HYPO|nr:hypothetical protein HIM_04344 [Hirsutella minnesotensis 3608]
MLDDNLPAFRLQPSSDDPLLTLVFHTHNGSEPSATYLLKRPPPAQAKSQYAVGLLDAQLPSLVYAEVLVRPEWTSATLSAAEVRAHSGSSPPPLAVTPDTFAVSLYDPDLEIAVKHRPASWSKSDAWEFEVPERSFRLPSASLIDREGATAQLAALAPKVVFRWKRDGRLSKDMTCYMSGRSVGGKKSKEPDITVAMFRAAKNEGILTVYEPNLARVEVEDRKGLELSLILTSTVIRDLYLAPRADPFNVAGVTGPTQVGAPKKGNSPRPTGPSSQPVFASGALGLPPPHSPPSSTSAPPPGRDARQHADIEAETRRLQAMVAEENRKAREREKRDLEEQKRIKKMLEQEENERRKREAEVDKETERLRREYGYQAPSPALPPRNSRNQLRGGW